MASAVLSVSSRSGFSMEEDWALDSSDNGSAISNQQDVISSHGPGSPSFSINSHGSWVFVKDPQHSQRMVQSPSPALPLDTNVSHASYTDPLQFGTAEALPRDLGNGHGTAGFGFSSATLAAQQQIPLEQYVIGAHPQGQAAFPLAHGYSLGGHNAYVPVPTGFDFTFEDILRDTTMTTMNPQSQSLQQYNMPFSMRIGTDEPPPWNHASVQASAATAYGQFDPSSIERFTSSSRSSIELSPKTPPGSLLLTQKAMTSKADRTHGTKRKSRDTAKIRKPRKRKSLSLSSSSSPRPSSSDPEPGENPVFRFCNMNADNWGKSDFEGMSSMVRSSQKGRKGALSEDTRANALAVRKTGACFCCHVRKVKCDKQRPCQSCLKFCNQVSPAICWQFEDFNKALFPSFIRQHFDKEEMSRFVLDNVQSFTLNGIEQPCTVILSSGPVLISKLVVKAKFFTAKMLNSNVLQHWLQIPGGNRVNNGGLERRRAAPIGLEMDTSKWNELRRKVDDYVHNIVKEPAFAWELTASMRKPNLPRRTLQIIQRYSQQSNSSIVKRALDVYAMHYMMTRQLTLTQQSIDELRLINPVRATGSYMTTRLLARQIKAVIDVLIRDGVKALFGEFSRRLKSRSSEEWAPCLAAFLVLCLLMEATETAADGFAISENDIGQCQSPPVKFERTHALEANKCIEDGPFKQLAFQFHQIYQTHSTDTSTKSLNPLADSPPNKTCDLKSSAALELVQSLRDMLQTDWSELQSLTVDTAMYSFNQNHQWPRNVSEDYVGRLWSKFLLSFIDRRYIFGSWKPDG